MKKVGEKVTVVMTVNATGRANTGSRGFLNSLASFRDPANFTIRTIPKRLDKVGDPWKPVVGRGIDLEACLGRLT